MAIPTVEGASCLHVLQTPSPRLPANLNSGTNLLLNTAQSNTNPLTQIELEPSEEGGGLPRLLPPISFGGVVKR